MYIRVYIYIYITQFDSRRARRTQGSRWASRCKSHGVSCTCITYTNNSIYNDKFNKCVYIHRYIYIYIYVYIYICIYIYIERERKRVLFLLLYVYIYIYIHTISIIIIITVNLYKLFRRTQGSRRALNSLYNSNNIIHTTVSIASHIVNTAS